MAHQSIHQAVYAHPSFSCSHSTGRLSWPCTFLCVVLWFHLWVQLFYSEFTKNQKLSELPISSVLPFLAHWLIPLGFCMHRFEREVWNSVSIEASAFMKTWFLSMSRVAFCCNSWILKGILLDMLLKVILPVLERLPTSCFSQNLKGRSGKAQISGCRKFILLWHWAAFVNISNLLEKNINSLQALH